MLVLRCTGNVLKRFRQRPRQVEVSATASGLGEWYVNTADDLLGSFYLIVHAKSLYAVVVDGASVPSIGDLVERMLERLARHMASLGIRQAAQEKVLAGYEHFLVAKTASRSVLGSMNDLTTHLYLNMAAQMGATGKLDLWAIEQKLDNMPQRPIGWGFPSERFAELCAAL